MSRKGEQEQHPSLLYVELGKKCYLFKTHLDKWFHMYGRSTLGISWNVPCVHSGPPIAVTLTSFRSLAQRNGWGDEMDDTLGRKQGVIGSTRADPGFEKKYKKISHVECRLGHEKKRWIYLLEIRPE